MFPMTATDALNAALPRWKRLLFADFSFGRLLKLGFIALLAEFSGGGASWNYSSPRSSPAWQKLAQLPHAIHAGLMVFFVGLGVIFFVIGIIIFYLSCRAKFAEFHIAATGDTRVAPPWRIYAGQTWRLFWTTLVVHILALLVLAAIAVPMFMAMMHHGAFSGSFSLRQLLGVVLLLLPLFFVWILVVQFVQMIIRDIMLPCWALQDATVAQSWQIARAVIENDPKAFAGYTLMKVVMHIVLSIAAVLAFAAAVLVSGIPFGGVGLAIFLPLHHGAIGAKVVMVALLAGLAVLAAFWVALLVCAIFGTAQFVLQCYAVEWFAGRYPPLAAWMYPPPPAPLPPVDIPPAVNPPISEMPSS
jgi:hypothetical protein